MLDPDGVELKGRVDLLLFLLRLLALSGAGFFAESFFLVSSKLLHHGFSVHLVLHPLLLLLLCFEFSFLFLDFPADLGHLLAALDAVPLPL